MGSAYVSGHGLLRSCCGPIDPGQKEQGAAAAGPELYFGCWQLPVDLLPVLFVCLHQAVFWCGTCAAPTC